jgi:D-amino-acid dehydrogenase
MLELVGMDARVDPRRVELLRQAARTYLASWEPDGGGRAWAGLRPLPPDGLPIIGPIPGARGMYVATGHGMVGVTLAPATAALVAAEILDGAPSPILELFRPGRF